MTLTIIIPFYNTEEKILKRLLDTINNQKVLDLKDFLNVVIIDDCSKEKPLNSLDLSEYTNFDISIGTLEENKGPGYARQIGILNSKSDYIMFCDSDDVLFSDDALSKIKPILEEKQPDILSCAFLEEVLRGKTGTIVEHFCNDRTWMHGKVYKRSFLVDNNITFRPDLRENEDGYFNSVAFGIADNVEYSEEYIYIWKWNDTSLTRNKECEYNYKAFENYLKAMYYASYELSERESVKTAEHVLNTVFYTYFVFQSDKKWKTSPYRERVLRRFKIYFNTFKNAFECVGKKDLISIYKNNMDNIFSYQPFMAEKSFDDWLKELDLEYKEREEETKCLRS